MGAPESRAQFFGLGATCEAVCRLLAGWQSGGISGRMGGSLTIEEGADWGANEAVWSTFGTHLGRENGLIVRESGDLSSCISERF